MDVDRIWNHIDATGPCWLWTRGTDNGYGRVWIDGRAQFMHRVVYELLVGPIPSGMTLDHLCRVLLCCNPDHLEIATIAENVARSPIKGPRQTHCKRGHSLADAYVRSNGSRKCRRCHALREAAHRQNQSTT